MSKEMTGHVTFSSQPRSALPVPPRCRQAIGWRTRTTATVALHGARIGTDNCTIGGSALSDGNAFSACDDGVHAAGRTGTVIRSNRIDAIGSAGICLPGGTATVQQNL
jgi:hypothetical protein